MATNSDRTEDQDGSLPLPQWTTLDHDSDTKTPVATEIAGKIPKWLNGSLYRNGPGVFQVGEQRLEHLCDGFAVLQRFLIQEGGIHYQSRILDSESWLDSCKANRLVVSQFSTYAYPDDNKSMFDKMVSYLLPVDESNMADNTAVNIVAHGDKLLALADASFSHQIHPETLLKIAKVDMKDSLGVQTATAHPHFDEDGTMYNLASNINPASAYSIIAVPPPTSPTDGEAAEGAVFGKAKVLTSLASRFNMHISYIHSFGMTPEHFVLLDQPIAVNILKHITSNWRRESSASNIVTLPDEKMEFYVVRRSDNQSVPVRFETDHACCFHFVNCYEVEEYLVVDLCAYDQLNMAEDLLVKNVADKTYKAKCPQATLRRFVLPFNVTEADSDVNLVTLAGTSATAYMNTPGVIHCSPDYLIEGKLNLEMPRINYAYNGKKYRFAYGVSSTLEGEQLAKVDLEKKSVLHWKEPGYTPGEPVFVPKPGSSDEDDGVVLSQVLSELPDTPSYLLILDAKTFKEQGRAFTPCDVKIALTFHGTFVPKDK